MTIQGLMDRALRGFKNFLNRILGVFDKDVDFREWNKHKRDRPLKKRKLRKKTSQHFRKNSAAAHIETPQKIDFQEDSFEEDQQREFYSNKKRIPRLLNVKRIIAGLLLLVNFVFSQFLIAATNQDLPMWIIYVGNSFIILDYLWKTRRRT